MGSSNPPRASHEPGRSARLLLVLLCVLLLGGGSGVAQEEPELAPPPPPFPTLTAKAERTLRARDLPRRLAVLPCLGEGSAAEREDIRLAIHNHLAATPFELMKPFLVDRQLALFEEENGVKVEAADPKRIAAALGVDGLVLIHLDEIHRIYAGAYAQYSFACSLALYAEAADAVVWRDRVSVAQRAGGVSLSPLSMVATAIASARVLRDSVRVALVDELARKVAEKIPTPKGGHRKGLQPPTTAFSNAADGPFASGAEVVVYARAKAGLGARFDIGSDHAEIPMHEEARGEYVGRYVVRDGDDGSGGTILLHLVDPESRAHLDWRVVGRIRFDTRPPAPVVDLMARPTSKGVRLTWRPGGDPGEVASYRVSRAEVGAAEYTPVGEAAVPELVDATCEVGHTYHYRVVATDGAGNRSPVREVAVAAVAPGPTELGGEIDTDRTLYAVGSPYEVGEEGVRVLRGATLRLEPGCVVELAAGATVEVLGRCLAEGTAEGPIHLRGSGWRLLVRNTGTTASRLVHCIIDGPGSGITATGSTLELEHCLIRSLFGGVAAEDRAVVSVRDTTFERNTVALRAAEGQLLLDDVVVRNNGMGIDLEGGGTAAWSGVRFEGNDTHVKSVEPVEIPSTSFADDDYETLKGRLDGAVQVVWEAAHDLRATWARGQWEALATALRADRLADAAAVARRLAEETGDVAARRWAAILPRLAEPPRSETEGAAGGGVAPSEVPVDSPLVAAWHRSGGAGQLWLQEVRLAVRPGAASDRHLVRQACRRATLDYLRDHYPGMDGDQRLAAAAKVALTNYILASEVVHTRREGLFTRVWLLHLVDRGAVNDALALVGLIQRPPSTIRVGVVVGKGGETLADDLFAALGRQRVAYHDLGSGPLGPERFTRAAALGDDLLLEVRARVEAGDSGIGSRLHSLDGEIDLTLYEVTTGQVLRRFQAADRRLAFQVARGEGALLDQLFSSVEPKLLGELFARDREAAGESGGASTARGVPSAPSAPPAIRPAGGVTAEAAPVPLAPPETVTARPATLPASTTTRP